MNERNVLLPFMESQA